MVCTSQKFSLRGSLILIARPQCERCTKIGWPSMAKRIDSAGKATPRLHSRCKSTHPMVIDTSPNITIRVGCRLVYQAIDFTPIILIIRPRAAERQWIVCDQLSILPYTPYEELMDWQGNPIERWD